MLRRDIDPVKVMGFAQYSKKDGVETTDLIAAARDWQNSFLAEQPGIAMHCFLGNLNGDFADAILMSDLDAFQNMSKQYGDGPSSMKLHSMLNPESIRMTRNTLLKDNVRIPKDFSCIEFGILDVNNNSEFSEAEMLEISGRIERDYLSRFSEPREHIMGRVSNETYSEIAFVNTLAAAREICMGYLGNPTCKELLDLFDSETFDLDFWYVLA